MQTGGIRIGKLFGIEIWLDYSWLIIFVLILISFTVGLPAQIPGLSRPAAIGIGLITTLLFFASVIAHELSHSVYARRHGLEVRRITLFVFGGASELPDEPNNAKQEFVMAAVGPLASLGAALLFGLLWLAGHALSYRPLAVIGSILAIVNVSLAIFNVLPGFPLDGGRMFRSIVWWRTNDLQKATRYAAAGGRTLGVLLILYGAFGLLAARSAGGLWLILIGFFLYQAATASYLQTMARLALKDIAVSDLMDRHFASVDRDTSVRTVLENYALRHTDPVVVVQPDNTHGAGVVDVRQIAKQELNEPVGEHVAPVSRTAQPTEPVSRALVAMMQTGQNKLPVVQDGRLVGVLNAERVNTYVTAKSRLRT